MDLDDATLFVLERAEALLRENRRLRAQMRAEAERSRALARELAAIRSQPRRMRPRTVKEPALLDETGSLPDLPLAADRLLDPPGPFRRVADTAPPDS